MFVFQLTSEHHHRLETEMSLLNYILIYKKTIVLIFFKPNVILTNKTSNWKSVSNIVDLLN